MRQITQKTINRILQTTHARLMLVASTDNANLIGHVVANEGPRHDSIAPIVLVATDRPRGSRCRRFAARRRARRACARHRGVFVTF